MSIIINYTNQENEELDLILLFRLITLMKILESVY